MTSGSGGPDVAFLAGAPGGEPSLIRHAEPVMGTVVSFSVLSDQPPSAVAAAIQSACAVLHRADLVFSTWKPQSPVSRMRRGEAQPDDLPAEVTEVLRLCEAARKATGGW